MASKATRKIIATSVQMGTDYEKYIGYLFLDENGVYSVLETTEDIAKAHTRYKARPLNVFVVSKDTVLPGEKLLGWAVNKELHHKVFTYNGFHYEGEGILNFTDENGKEVLSTKAFLGSSYKFENMATPVNKKTIVKKQSLDIFSQRSGKNDYDVINASYADFSGRQRKAY